MTRKAQGGRPLGAPGLTDYQNISPVEGTGKYIKCGNRDPESKHHVVPFMWIPALNAEVSIRNLEPPYSPGS